MTRLWKRATVLLALWIPLSLGLAVSAQAQQPGILVGRVIDRTTTQPIVDARVLIAGTAIATRTSEDGRFRLSNVTPGSVTIRVVRLGYAAESRVLTIAEGTNSPAEFSLSPVAITMDQMVVTATGETERRRVTAAGAEIVV